MSLDVTLRPSRFEDNPFLCDVYADVRRDELAAFGWSAAQGKAFLQMQFAARQQGYAAQFPEAVCSVVRLGEVSVGSMIVASGPDSMCLVDISILSAFRGRGIGRRLVEELLEQASKSGLPVRLSVARGNRAARLYGRLGFVETGEDAGGVYVLMEMPAGVSPAIRAHGP